MTSVNEVVISILLYILRYIFGVIKIEADILIALFIYKIEAAKFENKIR